MEQHVQLEYRANAWDVHVGKLSERQYIRNALVIVDRYVQQAYNIQEKSIM
jgi:hypothetical protein